MTKINGIIKLVCQNGKVNANACMAAWEKRAESRMKRDRNRFLNVLNQYIKHAERWEEEFTYRLHSFWSRIPDTLIAKGVLVTMVTAEMYNADIILAEDLPEVIELFLNFVDANIGERGSDAMMYQSKGRIGFNPSKIHVTD